MMYEFKALLYNIYIGILGCNINSEKYICIKYCTCCICK